MAPNLRELRDGFLERVYGNTAHGVRWSILEEFIQYAESCDDLSNQQQQEHSRPRKILTEEDAARRLNRSPKTLRRWRQRGILPFIRLGAGIAYTNDILDEFVKRNMRNVAA